MELDIRNGEICLTDDAPVGLHRARGVAVTCTAGRVWLTVEGEAADIHLAAGERHVIAGNGLALLESLGGGRVRLETPGGRRSRLRRLAAALGRLGIGGLAALPGQLTRRVAPCAP